MTISKKSLMTFVIAFLLLFSTMAVTESACYASVKTPYISKLVIFKMTPQKVSVSYLINNIGATINCYMYLDGKLVHKWKTNDCFVSGTPCVKIKDHKYHTIKVKVKNKYGSDTKSKRFKLYY